ncbi:MAG: hypothetical protein ACF8TS_07895, partial [Maioricimonas sp. JB049]
NPEKGNGKIENLRKTMSDLHALWKTATVAGFVASSASAGKPDDINRAALNIRHNLRFRIKSSPHRQRR